jgi:hypothetical protein
MVRPLALYCCAVFADNGRKTLTVGPFWDSGLLGELRFRSDMLGSGRGADVARSELKYHANLVVDLVTLRQSLALFEWDPGTF